MTRGSTARHAPVAPASGTWGSERLDLGAYLRRIGHRGAVGADVATLRALHRAHVSTIPFENLDILLGRPIDLDVVSLQAKLVTAGRGGYCHEHGGLFAAVLEHVGLSFVAMSARATFGDDAPRPTTHMCLRVFLDGQWWLADVGLGADGLLEPIPFADGAVATASGGSARFRLRERAPGCWALESSRDEGWLELYHFTLEARLPIDYRVFTWYTSTHPRSPFISRVIAQRVVADDDRRFLVGNRLTRVGRAWQAETQEIMPSDLGEILRRDIGIVLDPDELDALGRYVVAAPLSGRSAGDLGPPR